MTVLKAITVLICLVSVIGAYPVGRPQTAENKGRGRSYPLIISHYSNVRNSKYNAPPATEAPTTAAAVLKESDDLKQKVDEDDDDMHSPSASLDEKSSAPSADHAADESTKKSEEEKTDELVINEEADEKNDTEKPTDVTQPNMVTNADSLVPKNESISVATAGSETVAAEDSLLISKAEVVVPSTEKPEVVETIEFTEGSNSTATILTHSKEEVPTQTTSLVEADKPASLGESDSTAQQVKTEMDISNVAVAMDSVAKLEETTTTTTTTEKIDSPMSVEPIAPSDETANVTQSTTTEQVKVAEAALVPSPEVKLTIESTPVESSRTAVLASEKEKTSEFFEDRSFKDRAEPELILAAIRQSAAAFGVGEEQKIVPTQIDDVANEGIRLQRDDNKKTTEKKEKEKEKYLAKPSKEKKPIKQIQSNDPVQEYDDIVTRAGKSKDDAESTTDTTLDKALAPEEPITLSLVPGNYPVVLPSGESILSDQITPENVESLIKTVDEPSVISLTPTNYPVVLPSGESTLIDRITPEETKSSASEEPITISLVPSNYPVVLPSGESTLSDKIKPEDLESPTAVKTAEK